MDNNNNKNKNNLIFIVFVILIVFATTFIQQGRQAQDQAQVQETAPASSENTETGSRSEYVEYTFANDERKQEHFEKHGVGMGFENADEYEKAASDVVNDPDVLHKIEAEDGDDVYYLERTNELVIVSTYGKIRTYFLPDDGKAYFDRT